MPRYRVQITAMNPPSPAPLAPDGELLTPEARAQEEVFRQTFDELNVPAVIAFLNRARRIRRKAAST